MRADYLSLLILAAAGLAAFGPYARVSTACILLLVALINFILSQAVLRPRTLRPKTSHQIRLLYREVGVRAVQVVFVLWILLLALAATRSLSLTNTALFAAAVAVASVPVGLPGLIAWLQENSPRVDNAKVVRPIAAAALASLAPGWSALCLVLCSLLVATLFDVPIGIGLEQLVALDVLVMFCLATLRHDRPQPKASAIHYWPYGRLVSRRITAELFWSGVLAGGLAYTNFMLFFWRRGLSAEYVTPGSHIHAQATAIAFATLSLCVLLHILHRRSPHGLFSRQQLHNKQLWRAMATALFCIINIVYNPLIAPYFQAASLSAGDLLCVGALAVLFIAVLEFERHTRWHSRTQLFARHHPAKIKKHLNPA